MATTFSVESSSDARRFNVGRLLANSGPLLILLLLVALLYIAAPAFRRPTSILLVGLQASFVGIVAIGQTAVILTGGIDLSVEAMVGFSSVVAAILISGTNQSGGQIAGGIPSWAAIPVAIVVGALIGALQGVVITSLNISPFIVTLGFLSILTGSALTLTNGSPINIKNDPFIDFLSSSIRSIGGEAGLQLPIAIPVPLVIAIVLYAVMWVVLRHTKLGRYVYAIGGNETAARLSGVNVRRTKILVYAMSGLLAAISGVLVMGRLQTGAYQNGTDYTLTSVAAVVIGGTALAGGVGGVWGTLIGAFIMEVVRAALVYLDVPPNAHKIVIGVIIVLAVALDVIRRGEVSWLRRIFRSRAVS